MTVDHGPQPVLAMIAEQIRFRSREDRRKPVLIPAGALGRRLPSRDMVASPQHRIWRPMPCKTGGVLVAATKLCGRRGIRRMFGLAEVDYYNIMMERHEIITANGCLVESLLVTPYVRVKLISLSGQLPLILPDMESARPIVVQDPDARCSRLKALL